jgi:hypothetical protein
MVATAVRIGFIREEFRRAVSESAEPFSRYGALARESEDPVETFFDSEADAQVMADERQDLLSRERRRFSVTVTDIAEVLKLDYTGTIPVARYVDAERDADLTVLISDITVDFGKNSATLTIWG